MADSFIDQVVRRQNWLERVADVIQGGVGWTYKVLGAPGVALKNLMHGSKPLGHPLHPALSDVPIGAWVAGVIADDVAHFTTRLPTAAGDVALAVGLIVAVPTALAGLTDYHETFGHERRVAAVHGMTMFTAVALDTVSLAFRWWGGGGLHTTAVALATIGLAVVLFGGYLGGHLVFGIGTMVNRNAFAEGPEESYVAVGASTDFAEGALTRVDAGGMPALVVRRGGQLRAIAAVCSHAGGPLDEGTIEGNCVTCPWHGSQFSVVDGHVHRGPATFAQPVFSVRETDGRVEVKLASPMH